MDAKSTDVISRLESAVSAWSEELQSAHMELERRLADAASRLANEVEGELFDTGPILEAVESSQARIGEVRDAVDGVSAHTRDLEQRLDTLESSVRSNSSMEATVAELVNRVDRLAKREGGDSEGIASVRAELQELRDQFASAKPADEALVREFAKVGMEVSQLRSALKEIGINQDVQDVSVPQLGEMDEPSDDEVLVSERDDDVLVSEPEDLLEVQEDEGLLPFREPETPPAPVGNFTDDALKRLAFDEAGHRRRLGDILTAANAITEGQLDEALEQQSRIPTNRIGTILVELGAATELTIARVLSAQLQLPYVELGEESIDDEAIALVSPRLARNHQCIPVSVSGNTLLLAMANPLDLIAIEDVELATRKRVDPVVATQSQVDQAIDTFYGPHVDVQEDEDQEEDQEEASIEDDLEV